MAKSPRKSVLGEDLTQMGQTGPPGEPNLESQSELERINSEIAGEQALADEVPDEPVELSPEVKAMQEQIDALRASLPAEMRPPNGEYKRDYGRDRKNLAVTGGLEVEHAPDFVPKPPSYIPVYMNKTGGTTPSEGIAAKDSDGNPVKTEIYKRWLDAKMEGRSLTGDVRNEILHNPDYSDDHALQEFIEE